MSETALSPCPFCGGEASIRNGGPGCHFVQCDTCNATSDDHGEERAIAAWNRRAASQEPVPVANEIADAVLGWMVKYDLLDAGNEYSAADVLAVLNDLTPSERASPVPPVVGEGAELATVGKTKENDKHVSDSDFRGNVVGSSVHGGRGLDMDTSHTGDHRSGNPVHRSLAQSQQSDVAALSAHSVAKPCGVAWQVRDNPDESDDVGRAFDVLVPSGEWRTCIAVGPSDARDCIRDEWLKERAVQSEYLPPVDYAISCLSHPAQGWREMDSAPKDGTSILAAHNQAAIVVYWQEDNTIDGRPGWADGEGDLDGLFYTYPVFVWQPLPPLPSAPAGGSDA